ncbi:MAG: hypothetical protein AAF701_03310, partial [Pseudomonadota bacterium]
DLLNRQVRRRLVQSNFFSLNENPYQHVLKFSPLGDILTIRLADFPQQHVDLRSLNFIADDKLPTSALADFDVKAVSSDPQHYIGFDTAGQLKIYDPIAADFINPQAHLTVVAPIENRDTSRTWYQHKNGDVSWQPENPLDQLTYTKRQNYEFTDDLGHDVYGMQAGPWYITTQTYVRFPWVGVGMRRWNDWYWNPPLGRFLTFTHSDGRTFETSLPHRNLSHYQFSHDFRKMYFSGHTDFTKQTLAELTIDTGEIADINLWDYMRNIGLFLSDTGQHVAYQRSNGALEVRRTDDLSVIAANIDRPDGWGMADIHVFDDQGTVLVKYDDGTVRLFSLENPAQKIAGNPVITPIWTDIDVSEGVPWRYAQYELKGTDTLLMYCPNSTSPHAVFGNEVLFGRETVHLAELETMCAF